MLCPLCNPSCFARPFTSALCTDVKDVGYVIVSDQVHFFMHLILILAEEL